MVLYRLYIAVVRGIDGCICERSCMTEEKKAEKKKNELGVVEK